MRRNFTIGVLLFVATLGYFVDVYDLIIFSVVRSPSLRDLGVPATASLSVGLELLNWQMVGLLLGGIAFGSFADKKGRLPVLFGSILLYSTANLLNAHISTIGAYSALRFFAGFGLAGQLGAGVSIVAETLSAEKRGLGTMLIAAVGLLGAVVAGFVGSRVDWRTAFSIGGWMGIVLLVLRLGLSESEIFRSAKLRARSQGNFLLLLRDRGRFTKYLKCILWGAATYLVVGIVITGAPEFAKDLGVRGAASAATAIWLCYLSMAIGDLACTVLSQVLRSRRQSIILFNVIIALGIISMALPLYSSLAGFYLLCSWLGFGCGFWSLVVTFAAEQFGTDLRATVATTVPNFIRAALIPISYLFGLLTPQLGRVQATIILGIVITAIAIIAAVRSSETFARPLDFLES